MHHVVHRLFFAFLPPLQQRRAIALQRDGVHAGAGAMLDARLHMTLWITDDFDGPPLALADRLRGIADRLFVSPFDFALDCLAGGKRSIALRPGRRPAALAAFQSELAAALDPLRALRPDWRFNPHVTLAYRPGTPFTQPIAPIYWPVTDFALIHSRVGATEHIELRRWPLVSRQGTFGF